MPGRICVAVMNLLASVSGVMPGNDEVDEWE
jgi:hypothetical protein